MSQPALSRREMRIGPGPLSGLVTLYGAAVDLWATKGFLRKRADRIGERCSTRHLALMSPPTWPSPVNAWPNDVMVRRLYAGS